MVVGGEPLGAVVPVAPGADRPLALGLAAKAPVASRCDMMQRWKKKLKSCSERSISFSAPEARCSMEHYAVCAVMRERKAQYRI